MEETTASKTAPAPAEESPKPEKDSKPEETPNPEKDSRHSGRKLPPLVIKGVRGVCFFVLLGLMLFGLNHVYLPKNNTKENGMRNASAFSFYAEPANTIDTMIIGNSDAYSAFSPMEMWNAYGMTSYVSGQGHLIVPESYTVLEQVLQNQTPKVLVVETDTIFSKYTKQELEHKTAEVLLYRAYPLLQNHDRWKNMDIAEVFQLPDYHYRTYAKGQYMSCKVDPYKGDPKKKNKVIQNPEMDWPVKFYLNRIKEVCDEKGIKLILVRVPCLKTRSVDNQALIRRYADEIGVEFLDLDYENSPVNINWKTDTRDKGTHLNCYGAKKVSLYLGQYLMDHYGIVSRKDDASVASAWNKDYERYQEELEKQAKAEEQARVLANIGK